MHYKNGRPANNGDKVVLMPSYGPANLTVGILYDAVAGNDYCNGRIAVTASNDPSPNLKECLHLDDFLTQFAAGAVPEQTPDQSVSDATGVAAE